MRQGVEDAAHGAILVPSRRREASTTGEEEVEEDIVAAEEEENASFSEEELSKLTVPVLKEKLKEAGLPVSGKKAELISRLLA